jgi:hypothetical protein
MFNGCCTNVYIYAYTCTCTLSSFHCGSMNYAYSLIHLSDNNLFFEQIFTEVGIYIVVDCVVYLYRNALGCIITFHGLHMV